jgi:hypothetical protein
LEGKITIKEGFDRAVIARSNCGLMFVCNKSTYAGWGFWLSDIGRGSQKEIARITAIAKLAIAKTNFRYPIADAKYGRKCIQTFLEPFRANGF